MSSGRAIPYKREGGSVTVAPACSPETGGLWTGHSQNGLSYRCKSCVFLRASPSRNGRSENMEQTRRDGRFSLSKSIGVICAPNTSAVPTGNRREKIAELARKGRTPKELAEEFELTQTITVGWLKQAD
ncbi:Hypothetical protein SRM_00238 [Salinibacter ruber M8]|uniref:Uncharacterized protein n=1 Tax=Salinibacter ruber (strain M8) TaxID=761659 RepID=D5H554_SALRM|nr:Hypothetical protein SRM_00238 [Salinibacter ruber M8]